MTSQTASLPGGLYTQGLLVIRSKVCSTEHASAQNTPLTLQARSLNRI